MNTVLNLSVVFIIMATIAFLIAYSRRISWWFGGLKPQKKYVSKKINKFAVVIPARNEGKTLLPLIESLLRQTYDKNSYDVHIVVKESDDPTIGMVKEIMPYANFYIDPEQKTKGHALNYCIDQICSERQGYYDAFLIIDADCLLEDDYLVEMNNALANGRGVYNSKLVVKNYLNKDKNANSWASKCNGLIWTLMSECGNRARSDKGATIMVLGTGLMIRANLVEKWHGWPFQQTLTEDVELQRYCAINRIKTGYVSQAVCYVEESTSLHVSNIRRQRWMSGVVHCDRIYDEEQKKNISTKEDKLNYYAVHSLYYVYWYFGFLFFEAIALAISSIVLHFMGSEYTSGFFMLALVCLGLIYLGFFAMTCACMFVDRKYIKMNIFSKIFICLTHPIYYMGYIGVMIKCFTLKQKVDWKRIERVEFEDNVFEK